MQSRCSSSVNSQKRKYDTRHSAMQVLNALDKEERRLFANRLRYLDRRIMPGVNKLMWTSPRHALDFFHKEACQ